MATVLFVCLHNAGRSQMSAALFERAAPRRHVALSAGTAPAERVHPEVVEVMRDPGFVGPRARRGVAVVSCVTAVVGGRRPAWRTDAGLPPSGRRWRQWGSSRPLPATATMP
jgi:hypothetical protein